MSKSSDTGALDTFGGDRRLLEIMTPEGVPLTVVIADIVERGTAFGIDFFLVLLATIALSLPILVFGGGAGTMLDAVLSFVIFLVSNLYFVAFELRWRGSTPGKRVLGLRVTSRNGGPVHADAVIARNLMREVESFLPLKILLLSPYQLAIEPSGRILPLAGWIILFGVLPLLNSCRQRAGDLVAGTLVIALPNQMLLEDLVQESRLINFTDDQLSYYGEAELRALDDVLRRPKGDAESNQLRRAIFDRIRRRIGWSQSQDDVDLFLSEFYTAQRAFLEKGRLTGRRKPRKGYGPILPRLGRGGHA
jgi:uncharacterized RDD family membrane protein YckC